MLKYTRSSEDSRGLHIVFGEPVTPANFLAACNAAIDLAKIECSTQTAVAIVFEAKGVEVQVTETDSAEVQLALWERKLSNYIDHANESIQDVVDDVLERAKKYGFKPDEDMVSEAVEESANLLKIELTETQISEACQRVMNPREVQFNQPIGFSLGGFTVGNAATMTRCTAVGTIVGVEERDGRRFVTIEFDEPQAVDAPEGATSKRFELTHTNITSTWAKSRDGRKMAKMHVDIVGGLASSALISVAGGMALKDAFEKQWKRITRDLIEVESQSAGDLVIESLKTAMDGVGPFSDARAILIGHFCNEWNTLVDHDAHRHTAPAAMGARKSVEAQGARKMQGNVAIKAEDRIAALEIACRAERDAVERAERSRNGTAVSINRQRLQAAEDRLSAEKSRQMGISTILTDLASERWPSDESQPEDPTQAWAGECSIFVDAAWKRLESAGIDFSDEGMISKFSDLTCAVAPPPGMTLQEVSALGIESHINHHWLVSGGRHYDASCPAGVDSVFGLRSIRQTAAEVMQRDHPVVLERLCSEHPWWRDSVQLLNEFQQLRSATEGSPTNTYEAPSP